MGWFGKDKKGKKKGKEPEVARLPAHPPVPKVSAATYPMFVGDAEENKADALRHLLRIARMRETLENRKMPEADRQSREKAIRNRILTLAQLDIAVPEGVDAVRALYVKLGGTL